MGLGSSKGGLPDAIKLTFERISGTTKLTREDLSDCFNDDFSFDEVSQEDYVLTSRNFCDRAIRHGPDTGNLAAMAEAICDSVRTLIDAGTGSQLQTSSMIFTLRCILSYCLEHGKMDAFQRCFSQGQDFTLIQHLLDIPALLPRIPETYSLRLEAISMLVTMMTGPAISRTASHKGMPLRSPYAQAVMRAGSGLVGELGHHPTGQGASSLHGGRPVQVRAAAVMDMLLRCFLDREALPSGITYLQPPVSTALVVEATDHAGGRTGTEGDETARVTPGEGGDGGGGGGGMGEVQGSNGVRDVEAGAGASTAGGGGGGVFGLARNLAGAVISLPWYAWSHLFGAQAPTDGHPLSQRAGLLFLLLSQGCRGADVQNPYRESLCTAQDVSLIGAPRIRARSRSSASNAHSVTGSEAASGADRTTGAPMTLNMEHIYHVMPQVLDSTVGVLILYTLFHGNPIFKQFLNARTDLDRVVVPILRLLYGINKLSIKEQYIVVIVLLLFTQDPSFSSSAHKLITLDNVPWFSERILRTITLGSLVVIIVLQAVHHNLVRVHDAYLHSSCFAALSNMADSCVDLHPHAAQRLVALINIFFRKLERLRGRLETCTDAQESFELQQAITQHTEFLHSVLEFMSECLSRANLVGNTHLIYALLHRHDEMVKIWESEEFAAYAVGIKTVITFFKNFVDQKEITHAAELVEHIEEAAQAARGAGAYTDSAGDLHYSYDEVDDPEQFFIPFVWELVNQYVSELVSAPTPAASGGAAPPAAARTTGAASTLPLGAAEAV